MLTQFFLEITNFALNIFAALVISWVIWLYFDAWKQNKRPKEAIRVLGFLSLFVSFVLQAIFVESALIANPLLNPDIHLLLLVATRGLGYLLVILSLLADPLMSRPLNKSQQKAVALLMIPGIGLSLSFTLKIMLPILALVMALLYLRRVTKGMEDHLWPISLAFFFFALFEIISLGFIFRGSDNVSIFKLVAPFGSLWIIERVILFVGILILGKWVFVYLLKRVQTQLYMYFSLAVLLMFISVAVVFTFLLVDNVQKEAQEQLDISVRVLELVIKSKQDEVLSSSHVFAIDPRVINSIRDQNGIELARLSQNFLLTKQASTLMVLNSSGQVIARGEDIERIGDSLSDDPLFRRSLAGEGVGVSSVVTRDGVLAPEVSIRASFPVKDGEEIIGAVVVGFLVDNAFIDGIQKATGLATSIYGGELVSATSLTAEDGVTRQVGTSAGVTSRVAGEVLGKGESFSGSVSLINTPYFASILPLNDLDGAPVGMLFVGKPQATVLETVGRSIQLTFVFTGVLWLIAIVPSYIIARSVSKQMI